MRIVALADTHMFHDELRVPEGDVLVHAGDLTRRGTDEELEAVATFLRAQPHPEKIVVAGNHDWGFLKRPAAARALFADMTYLEDSGVEMAGLRWWGSPWQPYFHNWAFNLARGGALKAKWALIPETTDVLITHGPPLGFGDRASDGRGSGCEDLLARVKEVEPLLHLYGHIHEGRGSWRDGQTTFANVTTWECELPCAVIDVDPSTGQVEVVDI